MRGISYNGPYKSAEFSKINEDNIIKSFENAIQKAKKEIDLITSNKEDATFENTIEALEFSGEDLDRISSILFNLNAAETNSKIQSITQQVSPLLSEFSNDVMLNEKLWQRINWVYERKSDLLLNTEQSTLLEKKFKSFYRNGAQLDDSDKEELRTIDKELSSLKLKFGEHVLSDTNAYELAVTDQNQLSGVPEGAIEAAKQRANDKNIEGWLFTLDYPSYIPFLTYADNRALREELAKAFGRKGFGDNENNNEELILKIVRLREQRAQLLGYETHAHFVLEERMARTPDQVKAFLGDLLQKAKPAAKKEFTRLENFARQRDGISELQKWDSAYYAEKLKKQLFDFDEEELKPYFKLENVVNGVFTVAQKLFKLQFQEVFNIDKYHEDVQTFEVSSEDGSFIGLLYADFFPRPGKRNGAWMTSFKPQMIKNGINERPHISIVCNFTKPTPTKPSLLTFNEVTTLFHEFGHALHGMLANTAYPSLSGTNVYWDFVELPSQILENWCYEEETLKLFAKHYKTGTVIPMSLVKKIKDAATFNEGMQTLRQVSFGLLDLSWHGATNLSKVSSVKAYETKAFESTQLFPDIEDNCMSTSFSHIFQGGYSSGYYSYKWAEVLDADAFEYFKQEGIFNPVVAEKFKNFILSKGGTEDPMSLYKKFRGQEPRAEALLRRAGLIEK